jgi:hypothetical protein
MAYARRLSREMLIFPAAKAMLEHGLESSGPETRKGPPQQIRQNNPIP